MMDGSIFGMGVIVSLWDGFVYTVRTYKNDVSNTEWIRRAEMDLMFHM